MPNVAMLPLQSALLPEITMPVVGEPEIAVIDLSSDEEDEGQLLSRNAGSISSNNLQQQITPIKTTNTQQITPVKATNIDNLSLNGPVCDEVFPNRGSMPSPTITNRGSMSSPSAVTNSQRKKSKKKVTPLRPKGDFPLRQNQYKLALNFDQTATMTSSTNTNGRSMTSSTNPDDPSNKSPAGSGGDLSLVIQDPRSIAVSSYDVTKSNDVTDDHASSERSKETAASAATSVEKPPNHKPDSCALDDEDLATKEDSSAFTNDAVERLNMFSNSENNGGKSVDDDLTDAIADHDVKSPLEVKNGDKVEDILEEGDGLDSSSEEKQHQKQSKNGLKEIELTESEVKNMLKDLGYNLNIKKD